MAQNSSNELGPKAVDYRVAIYKTIAGSLPIIGGPIGGIINGFLSEVINEVIPNQRLDRIQKFAEALEAKIQELDPDQVGARFRDPEFIDLLEDSLTQAVRAVTQKRIEHIAAIIKHSLSDEDKRYVHYKKLLYILKELNDVEVLMLCGYARQHDNEFWDQHRDVISVVDTTYDTPQSQNDQQLVQEAHRAHLVQLKLLHPKFQKPKKGQLPEFDEKTGMIVAKGYTLASLGRLLMRCMDEPDRDFV